MPVRVQVPLRVLSLVVIRGFFYWRKGGGRLEERKESLEIQSFYPSIIQLFDLRKGGGRRRSAQRDPGYSTILPFTIQRFYPSTIQFTQRMGKVRRAQRDFRSSNFLLFNYSTILPFSYSIGAKEGEGLKGCKEILEIQPFYPSPFNYSFPPPFFPSFLP